MQIIGKARNRIYICVAVLAVLFGFGTGVSVSSAATSSSISVVQVAENFSASNNTSITVPISTTAGHLLVIFTFNGGTSTATVSITDSAGQAWAQTTSGYASSASSNRSAMFYKANSAAVTNVTATWTGSGNNIGAIVYEVAGVDASSPADGSVNSSFRGTRLTSLTSGSLTTTHANDILIYGTRTRSDETTWTPGTGDIIPTNGSNTRQGMQYEIVNATQTGVTTSMSWNSGTTGVAGIFAAFTGATGGGGGGPSITIQPANRTVTAGQTATFSVVATGTNPLTYQWSKNGGAISGATSSTYTTPAETTSDNGAQFTVVVSNNVGRVTSSAATLTVSMASALLSASASSLSFGNVNIGANASQSVKLTNTGNANVTVSNVTVFGAGFNAGGVSSGLILTPGQAATLTVTFAPAGSGSVTGSVSVASNASNSPDSVALSGAGVAAVNHSVALSWAASTSPNVVGYNTYSSAASGGPYTKLNSSPVSALAYTDSSVQAGQTYYYVVTAVDSSNMESPYSNVAGATVP